MRIVSEIEPLVIRSNKLREEKRHRDYKEVKRDLRDLNAIRIALDCYPSILDYWINFGIRKTRDNWEEFINTYNFGDKATIHAYQTKLLLLCLEIIIGINRKCLKEQVKQLLLY